MTQPRGMKVLQWASRGQEARFDTLQTAMHQSCWFAPLPLQQERVAVGTMLDSIHFASVMGQCTHHARLCSQGTVAARMITSVIPEQSSQDMRLPKYYLKANSSSE